MTEEQIEQESIVYTDNLKPSIGKFDGEEGYSWNQVSDAWIDGYKECQKEHEWHDLRKDPNDLPKDKRNVWCDYDNGYGKGFYDKDDGGWWIEGHIYCSIIDAWYELPTFDKE